MLDMGFENDIRKIITQLGMPEKIQRQTLMFSATFPDEIQKLAREFLNDYLFLAVGSIGGSNLDIKQEILDLQTDQKRNSLLEMIGQSGNLLKVYTNFSTYSIDVEKSITFKDVKVPMKRKLSFSYLNELLKLLGMIFDFLKRCESLNVTR